MAGYAQTYFCSFVLLSLVNYVSAETCHGAFTSIECIFGCCEDALFIYCCLSNGAGIGIIIGAVVVIFTIIFICYRRHRMQQMAAQQPRPMHSSSGAQVAVVNTSQYAYNNPGVAAPPPYYHGTAPAYPGTYPGGPAAPPYPGGPAAAPPYDYNKPVDPNIRK